MCFRLFISPDNSSLAQIIRGHFKCYFVSRKNPDKIWNQIARGIVILYVVVLALCVAQAAVCASGNAATTGANVITQGFSGLLDIVTALISAIGTIILLWGFFEWGISLQSQDGVMQSAAFKRIGGGLVMILAPQLLNIFLIQP